MSLSIIPLSGPDERRHRFLSRPDSNDTTDREDPVSELPHYRFRFGTGLDLPGWLRREIPALGARWLDIAEHRLHELVSVEQAELPPSVAELLAPENRALLRLALLHQLTPADLEPVPGGCQIPWTGCPDHGDVLSHRVTVPGWYCDAPGHEMYGEDTTLLRVRHCHQPAVAVLSAPGHALPVCRAHLSSELEISADCGEPFTVIDLAQEDAA